MGTIRKTYSATLKAQIVQETLAGEKTINQIAAEHAVHPNLITKWRRAVLTAMPATFADEGRLTEQITALRAQHEREKEALYAEIGRLTTQVHWLQKKITATGGLQDTAHLGRTRSS